MFSWFGRKRQSVEYPPLTEREFTDALMSERPSDSLARWAVEGRLRSLIPDLDALRGITQLPAHRDDAFIHTMKVVDAIEATPVRRWAALLHDIAKAPTFIETPEGRSRFFEHDRIGAEMVPEIMPDFVDDLSLVSRVLGLVRNHMRPISYNAEWSDAAVRRLYDDVEESAGREAWHDQMALARADLRGYLPEPIDRGLWVLDQLEAHRESLLRADRDAEQALLNEPVSPLDGHEIVALVGREPGPWIAAVKGFLLEEVRSGRLARDDKAAAIRLVRAWLDDQRL
ncbi:MAG: HD domain-containing protein [Chloroflexia bacterium]